MEGEVEECPKFLAESAELGAVHPVEIDHVDEVLVMQLAQINVENDSDLPEE